MLAICAAVSSSAINSTDLAAGAADYARQRQRVVGGAAGTVARTCDPLPGDAARYAATLNVTVEFQYCKQAILIVCDTSEEPPKLDCLPVPVLLSRKRYRCQTRA